MLQELVSGDQPVIIRPAGQQPVMHDRGNRRKWPRIRPRRRNRPHPHRRPEPVQGPGNLHIRRPGIGTARTSGNSSADSTPTMSVTNVQRCPSEEGSMLTSATVVACSSARPRAACSSNCVDDPLCTPAASASMTVAESSRRRPPPLRLAPRSPPQVGVQDCPVLGGVRRGVAWPFMGRAASRNKRAISAIFLAGRPWAPWDDEPVCPAPPPVPPPPFADGCCVSLMALGTPLPLGFLPDSRPTDPWGPRQSVGLIWEEWRSPPQGGHSRPLPQRCRVHRTGWARSARCAGLIANGHPPPAGSDTARASAPPGAEDIFGFRALHARLPIAGHPRGRPIVEIAGDGHRLRRWENAPRTTAPRAIAARRKTLRSSGPSSPSTPAATRPGFSARHLHFVGPPREALGLRLDRLRRHSACSAASME